MEGPPPSYQDSVPKPGSGAPPSYAELFPMKELKSEVSQAREEGMTPSVPLKICGIFCGSIACGICYLILALLPISMIVMGSIYLHDCKVQRMIPVFLIVFGCFAMAQTFLHFVKLCICRKKDDSNDNSDKKKKGGDCFESLITLFLFVWIIVGSYYTFTGWNQWLDGGREGCSGRTAVSSGDCCDAPVMYYAFSVLLFMYGMSALCCFCFCCCICCVTVLAAASSAE